MLNLLFICQFVSTSLSLSWGETESIWYCGHSLAYCTNPRRDCWLWSNRSNAKWQVKPKYSEKTCHSVTLSTTNPTWPDPDSKPGHRGGKPATNRLSYGTAFVSTYFRSVMYCDVCWGYGQEIGKRWPYDGNIHSRDYPSSRAELVSWRHHQKLFNIPQPWASLWRSNLTK
jgi:hypothetical protein